MKSLFQSAGNLVNAHMKNVLDKKTGETHDLLYVSRGKHANGMNKKSFCLVDPVLPEGKDEIHKGQQIGFTYETFEEKGSSIVVQNCKVIAVDNFHMKEDFDPNKEFQRTEAAQTLTEADVPFDVE